MRVFERAMFRALRKSRWQLMRDALDGTEIERRAAKVALIMLDSEQRRRQHANTARRLKSLI